MRWLSGIRDFGFIWLFRVTVIVLIVPWWRRVVRYTRGSGGKGCSSPASRRISLAAIVNG